MEENNQLTLEELKNKFEDYRKNKSYNRKPIPNHIWQAAVDLAKKHSIAMVSEELGLRFLGTYYRAANWIYIGDTPIA